MSTASAPELLTRRNPQMASSTIEIKAPGMENGGTVTEWYKSEGDSVAEGEILVNIETDKVVCEMPAPESGVLVSIVAETGTQVADDSLLALLEVEAIESVSLLEVDTDEVLSDGDVPIRGIIDESPPQVSNLKRWVFESNKLERWIGQHLFEIFFAIVLLIWLSGILDGRIGTPSRWGL